MDVLAISGLDRFIRDEDRRRVESNLLAREILQPRELGAGKAEHAEARRVRARQASSLLYVSGHLIDRQLRDQLWELAHAYREPPGEYRPL